MSQQAQQSVTIFSNGIADFRRVIDIKAGESTPVSIPVNAEYIGDILDSLHVAGKVFYDKPATYQPANEQAGSLQLEPTKVIETLATKLSGASVEVQTSSKKFVGKLLGLDTAIQLDTNSKSINVRSVLVLTTDGVISIALTDIAHLDFLDGEVKEEINKALKRNFQSIKPNSTFIDLTLKSLEDTQAILRYSIPSAAWTMTYSLRQTAAGYEFQGSAVVPNKTDEDWKDVIVSVVSGEPVTFSTDIAQSKIPNRQFVPIIKESSQGAVEVEEGFYNSSQVALADMGGLESARGAKSMRAMGFAPAAAAAGGAAPMMARGGGVVAGGNEPAADFQEAYTREVGDFSIFTAQQPMTIAAKRSALIPVFTKTVSEAKTVLYYKQANNSERPLRAIEFKNETDHSLNRGPCIIDQEGTFAGKSILPATKPGEKCLLTHAVETGLRIRSKKDEAKHEVISLRVADGVFYTTSRVTQQTTYRVYNSKNEQFRLLVDHDREWDGSEFKLTYKENIDSDEFHVVQPQQSLNKGFRVSLDVSPKLQSRFVAVETLVEKSKLRMNANNWYNQFSEYVTGDGQLRTQFKDALEIWDKITKKQQDVRDLQSEHSSKTQKQGRLRENLKSVSGGNASNQQSAWVKELADVEDTLTELENNKIPKAQKEIQDLQSKLQEALKSAQAEWEA